MPWFQEVTADWTGPVPNHTYLLNDSRSRMTAYVQADSGQLKVFANPLSFSTRGRKFVAVKDQWNVPLAAEKPAGRSWTVAGSKGASYTVSEHLGKWACTCAGFGFRSQCRHITEKQGS
jgi:hypothetical protein